MTVKLPTIFLHKRTVVQNSTKPYTFTLRVWQGMLLSFLCDAFFIVHLVTNPDLPPFESGFINSFAHSLIVACCLLSVFVCFALNRSHPQKSRIRLNFINDSKLRFLKLFLPALIVALTLLISTSSAKEQQSLFYILGGATIMGLALAMTGYKSVQTLVAAIQKNPRNIFLKVHPDAIQRVGVVLIGITASRCISVLSLFCFASQKFSESFFILFEVASLLLLFSCKPKLGYFVSKCPSCHSLRSVIFGAFPKCPQCYPRKFYRT